MAAVQEPEVMVQVVTVTGETVQLSPPGLAPTALVKELRLRVAAAMRVHPGRVALLFQAQELEDGAPLPPALLEAAADAAGLGGPSAVTALRLPCRLRPAAYADAVRRYPDFSTLPARPRWPNNRNLRGYVPLGEVSFPAPQDISINMMPFRIGDLLSVPEAYRQYWPMVLSCVGLSRQAGQVGYLTIHESLVPKGSSQRRPGAHTETPGILMHRGGDTEISMLAHWGRGDTQDGDVLRGGIYLASSVEGSCAIWNSRVLRPEEAVGDLGDIEHLREHLGDRRVLGASELVWLTDATPHESLPLPEDTYRQFFRVVSHDVSAWFAKHSTPNPLGVVPDPQITTIIYEDKFDAFGWRPEEEGEEGDGAEAAV